MKKGTKEKQKERENAKDMTSGRLQDKRIIMIAASAIQQRNRENKQRKQTNTQPSRRPYFLTLSNSFYPLRLSKIHAVDFRKIISSNITHYAFHKFLK